MANPQAAVNGDAVANTFVKRYTEVLERDPQDLIRFFHDESTFLHGGEGDDIAADHGVEVRPFSRLH